jgi:hypothetical protein
MMVLWRIDPLLNNDRETNNETTVFARKRPARQWTGWKVVFSVLSVSSLYRGDSEAERVVEE